MVDAIGSYFENVSIIDIIVDQEKVKINEGKEHFKIDKLDITPSGSSSTILFVEGAKEKRK